MYLRMFHHTPKTLNQQVMKDLFHLGFSYIYLNGDFSIAIMLVYRSILAFIVTRHDCRSIDFYFLEVGWNHQTSRYQKKKV